VNLCSEVGHNEAVGTGNESASKGLSRPAAPANSRVLLPAVQVPALPTPLSTNRLHAGLHHLRASHVESQLYCSQQARSASSARGRVSRRAVHAREHAAPRSQRQCRSQRVLPGVVCRPGVSRRRTGRPVSPMADANVRVRTGSTSKSCQDGLPSNTNRRSRVSKDGEQRLQQVLWQTCKARRGISTGPALGPDRRIFTTGSGAVGQKTKTHPHEGSRKHHWGPEATRN